MRERSDRAGGGRMLGCPPPTVYREIFENSCIKMEFFAHKGYY